MIFLPSNREQDWTQSVSQNRRSSDFVELSCFAYISLFGPIPMPVTTLAWEDVPSRVDTYR
jgi:hypothetical protein